MKNSQHGAKGTSSQIWPIFLSSINGQSEEQGFSGKSYYKVQQAPMGTVGKNTHSWVGGELSICKSVKICFSINFVFLKILNHNTLLQDPVELLHKPRGFMQCGGYGWQKKNLWFAEIFMEPVAPTTSLIYNPFKDRHQIMLSDAILLLLLMFVWMHDIRVLHWH